MSSRTEVLADTKTRVPISPWWHTAALVAMFLAGAILGALFQSSGSSVPEQSTSHPDMSLGFLGLIAMEWGLFLYVTRVGLSKSGTSIWELVGGRWQTWQAIVRDFALGAGLWLLWTGIERLLLNQGSGNARSIEQFLPQTALEIALWVVLSVSAGICEEFVFRGYLMRQFEVLTGNRWIALTMQAAVFGVSHGYQGWAACFRITVFAMLFGGLALWRRSLRAGMVAHAWTDIAAGIFKI